MLFQGCIIRPALHHGFLLVFITCFLDFIKHFSTNSVFPSICNRWRSNSAADLDFVQQPVRISRIFLAVSKASKLLLFVNKSWLRLVLEQTRMKSQRWTTLSSKFSSCALGRAFWENLLYDPEPQAYLFRKTFELEMLSSAVKIEFFWEISPCVCEVCQCDPRRHFLAQNFQLINNSWVPRTCRLTVKTASS